MAFFDGIRRQLRSVIEWENPSSSMLFFRWSDNGDEIKNASRLIVGPGQGCLFMYEGKIRGVYSREGMIDLRTANIPFWTTVSRVMQFFESEHKVGLFYFRTAKILDQKWGTTSTIKYEDPTYKFPVGLRAFGNYSIRITEPRDFFVNVVAGADFFTAEQLRAVFNDRIIQPLTDYLAEGRFTYTEIDANREEIARGLERKLTADFAKLGFEITDFRVEGTNFDEHTLARINRIADMTAEARAASAVGLDYSQVQQLDAMRDAAKNEGGAAGIGMGMGAGMGLGRVMAGAMAPSAGPRETGQAGGGSESIMDKLKKLKEMFEADLITPDEYSTKKQELLKQL